MTTTTNPYEIGVAYVDGKPLGKVERFDFVEEPTFPPLIETIMKEFFMEESLPVSAFTHYENGYEVTRVDNWEDNSTTITLRPVEMVP